ncbi:hypothetical protein [Marinagarivorans algicola]|nr:hypothetical protein [Marinagarivorans algicola]
MEDNAIKIRRSSNLIKGFMTLVIIMQAVQFYQTNIMDLGSIAGTIGVLSLLRGLLLSPYLLAAPLNHWFKSDLNFSKNSYKYFGLAFVLIIVSSF